MKSITYYDIKFANGLCNSPNTWRIRYALNIKGLPYKTEWLSFLEIPKVLAAAGIPKGDEFGGYTLPAIVDPNTGKALQDSVPIIEYLDAQYPDTPQLLPASTKDSQLAFINTILPPINMARFPLSISDIFAIVLPEDKAYFRASREAMFGRKFEEIAPQGDGAREAQLELLKAALDAVAVAFDEHAQGRTFFGGDAPDFADANLATAFACVKSVHGEDHELYKFMLAQNGGRWAKYVEAMDQWTSQQ